MLGAGLKSLKSGQVQATSLGCVAAVAVRGVSAAIMRLPVSFPLAPDTDPATILARLRRLENTRNVAPERRDETYFDTFDWRLYRRGLVLVSVREGRESWLELQTKDGTLEARTRAGEPPAFGASLPAGAVRAVVAPLIGPRRLIQRLRRTSTVRGLRVLDAADKTVARVEMEQARAAAAGPGKTSWRELAPRVRVVPVTGYDEAHARVERFVEAETGLAREERSRLDVALAAAGIEAADYDSKLAIRLDPALSSIAALRVVLRTLLRTVRANEDGVRADIDTEFLHDFRVAVRRTRSCLGQMKGVFAEAAVQRHREELAWLGRLTGPMRDLDVYLLHLDGYAKGLGRDVEPLRRHLAERRAAEHADLTAALSGARYRELTAAWGAFLDDPPPDAAGAEAERPILELASVRIARAYRRVLRRGRRIGPGEASADLHRLRIHCKKLRYLLEFFRSLYDGAELTPLVKQLKTLQDNLGDYRDLHLHRERLAGFLRDPAAPAELSPATLVALGRLEERLVARQAAERARFADRFTRFAGDPTRRRFARLVGTDDAS